MIYHFVSEDQKQKWLPRIFSADIITAECVSDPTIGSDAAHIKTRAVRQGDHFVPNGTKRFQASGAVTDLFIVFAVTDPDVHPSKTISAFDVEKGDPNLIAMEEFDTMGWRGLATVSELILHNVKVPVENLIRDENQGLTNLTGMLNSARVLVTSGLLGTARTWFAAENAFWIVNEALQIMGGIG